MIRVARRPDYRLGAYSWRYWRIVHWFCRTGYLLGFISGWSFGWGGGNPQPEGFWRKGASVGSITFFGRPIYVLGWRREKWGCLFLRRHWPYWPGGEPVAFGRCGRCMPWPCCGSIEREHGRYCTKELREKHLQWDGGELWEDVHAGSSPSPSEEQE